MIDQEPAGGARALSPVMPAADNTLVPDDDEARQERRQPLITTLAPPTRPTEQVQSGRPSHTGAIPKRTVPSGINRLHLTAPVVELNEFGLPMTALSYRGGPHGQLREHEEILLDDEAEFAALQERVDRLRCRPVTSVPRTDVVTYSIPPPLITSSKTRMAGDSETARIPQSNPDKELQKTITRQSNILIDECEDFVEAAAGQQVVGDEKTEAKELVTKIGDMLISLDQRDWVADQDRKRRLRKLRSTIKTEVTHNLVHRFLTGGPWRVLSHTWVLQGHKI